MRCAEAGKAPAMSYANYMKLTEECRLESRKNAQKDPLAMDVSMFNTDPEQLIRDCKGRVYGYVRVSTDHQDYARQIEAMLRLGVEERNIFKDKKSGRDFERDEFRRLMETLRPGDLLVVVALDRFGRNMTEIKEQWSWITRYRQAGIVVIDQPILNTSFGMYGMGSFLSELILAVFSLMAEMERDLIHKRMEDGLRRAKLEGKKLGRRRSIIPEPFWQLKDAFLLGEISQNRAAKELDIASRTFRSWVDRTGEIQDAERWEALTEEIEKREKEERIRRAQTEYGERKTEG